MIFCQTVSHLYLNIIRMLQTRLDLQVMHCILVARATQRMMNICAIITKDQDIHLNTRM